MSQVAGSSAFKLLVTIGWVDVTTKAYRALLPAYTSTHSFGSLIPSGTFSDCEEHPDCPEPYCAGRRYRYLLRWPTGIDNDRVALGIFANPSTATPDELDPTLKRWRNYCRAWGFGWSWTANVRAWRATDPKDVPEDPRAIGKYNDGEIMNAVCHRSVELIVCGWGKLGGQRGTEVLQLLNDCTHKPPHALRLNADGSPAHPLYLPADLKPIALKPYVLTRRVVP